MTRPFPTATPTPALFSPTSHPPPTNPSSSLGYMLEHYGSITHATNPVMTAYDSGAMTIEHGRAGARRPFVYKFEPPVGAGEGRKRLVGMHQESKRGLGLVSRGFVCVDGGAREWWGGALVRHRAASARPAVPSSSCVPTIRSLVVDPPPPLFCLPLLIQSDVTINHLILPPSLLLTIAFFALLQLAVLLAPTPLILSHASFAAPLVVNALRRLGLPATRGSVALGVRWCLLAPLVVPHVVEAVACARPLLRRFNATSRRVRWAYVSLRDGPAWNSLQDLCTSQGG